MRTVFLWGLLLPLLCQLCPGARGHSLGRGAAVADLEQLKSVLQHLETSLSAAPEEDQEPGVLAPGPAGSPELDEDGQRSLLLDLLLSARRSSSSCFGARMDRIGNASGLGCGRG